MQPQFKDSIKIISLEDLFIVCFVIIDDLYKLYVPEKVRQRPGLLPSSSDSEIITIAIVGELSGIDVEIRWYTLVKHLYLYLFPNLNERSRFNRRRRDLAKVINLLIPICIQDDIKHPFKFHDDYCQYESCLE